MSIRSALCFLLALLPASFACSSTSASDDAKKHEMEQWWKLYQTNSPEWPAARDRWCAGAQPEKEALVLNLLADMNRNATRARGTASGLEPGWKRGESELLHVDAPTAVPILVTTLRTWRDTVALEAVSDSLVQFGASDALIRALDEPQESDTPFFRSTAMRTLAGIGGEKAINRIALELKTGTDPLVRTSAVAALGRARRSDKARAAQVLVTTLAAHGADPAPDRVLDAIEALDEPKAATAVALFHRDAVAKKDARLADRSVAVLKKLTGVTVPGDDAETWIREAKRVVEGARP